MFVAIRGYAVGLVGANQQLQAAGSAGPLLDAVSGRGGRTTLILGFAVAHTLLVLLGFLLKESLNAPAMVWPSVGLLFVMLWLTPHRLWPAILLVQYLVEVLLNALPLEPFDPSTDLVYPLANAIDAVVGASIARVLIPDISKVRTRQALAFIGATALGAAAGALFGASVNMMDGGNGFALREFLHKAQIWWAGNWLGHLTVAPVVFCWLSRCACATRSSR